MKSKDSQSNGIRFYTLQELEQDTEQLIETRKNIKFIDDEFAINFICGAIFRCDKECDKSSFIGKAEKTISRGIRAWLRKDRKFVGTGFKVNVEPENEDTDQIGYYDLKFEHSDWSDPTDPTKQKYFVFECKLMNEKNARTDDYVYRPAKDYKKRGGLYRFLTNKYAANLNFGGMLGYVNGGSTVKIINNVKTAIAQLAITENKLTFGQLTKADYLNQRIAENENTFLSEHVRLNKDTNEIITNIRIYHLFIEIFDKEHGYL